jgi:hypothetical protein
MKWSDLPLRPTPRMLRQFAAAWLLVFAGMALHQGLAREHRAAALALAAVALVVGGLGLGRPSAIRWLYIGATVLAFPIGWTVSQVVLALMFYGVLTPVALCFRWRGRDPLRRRPGDEEASCWVSREPASDPQRYLRQY